MSAKVSDPARREQQALFQFLESCQAKSCADATRKNVEDRIRLIGREEDIYLAAQDPKQLEAYIKDCKVCNFRDEANSQLNGFNRQQLYSKLNAAGTDQDAVNHFLTECGDACPVDLRAEAQARLREASAHTSTLGAAPSGN
jgi:hypothetical protein